jgi:hypothetical protein
MTNFVFPDVRYENIGELEKDAGNLEREDKKLIILIVLEKYCKEKNTKSIRYSQLRELSDDGLTEFTNGRQTNYGGIFENYIRGFENEGYLKRDRISSKNSQIIPDISKINSLIDKKYLRNSLDKMNVKAYKMNAKPYEKRLVSEGLQISGGFYLCDSCSNHLVGSIDYNDDCGLQNYILLSIPWKIYIASNNDKNLQLSEPVIQKLLGIGKTIALKDKTMPFKIILEYGGSA